IHQHRVPADMIDVKMRAEHRIDTVARVVGRLEIGKEAALQHVPGWNFALLVVADTGIDDDPPAAGVDDERMDAHDKTARFGREMRHHPAERLHRFRRCLRQDKTRPADRLHLDDPGDRHIPDLPSVHCPTPSFNSCWAQYNRAAATDKKFNASGRKLSTRHKCALPSSASRAGRKSLRSW